MKIPGFIFYIESEVTGLRYQSVMGYDSETLAGHIAFRLWREFYPHILDAVIVLEWIEDIRAYRPPPLPAVCHYALQ